MDFNDRDDVFSDFLLDNEGNFIFSRGTKQGNRSNINAVYLYTKGSEQDTFATRKLNLNGMYIDEVKMKVDNVNKRYLFNSFYFTERRGNIDGIYVSIWDVKGDSIFANVFTRLDESVKEIAKSKGNLKFALNDFFIRSVLLKRDGSYLLVAEDFSTQSGNNNSGWNRWDYLYGSPYMSPYNYYYYNPSYWGYYRPYSSFNNNQSTRYYYDNILLLEISKDGNVVKDNIINKEQYADDNDNFLSFSTFITESQIHFLFNIMEKKAKLLTDNTLTASGGIKRNPTLRSIDRGYEFMPKLAKQVGASQIIIPCTFRNQICFAKVDF